MLPSGPCGATKTVWGKKGKTEIAEMGRGSREMGMAVDWWFSGIRLRSCYTI
jgi:hypothetical protein